MAILTGIFMIFVSLPFYLNLIIFSPGYIETNWFHNNLSGIRILTIPIEEFIFYFLAGFMVAPLYEWWKGERLRKVDKK